MMRPWTLFPLIDVPPRHDPHRVPAAVVLFFRGRFFPSETPWRPESAGCWRRRAGDVLGQFRAAAFRLNQYTMRAAREVGVDLLPPL